MKYIQSNSQRLLALRFPTQGIHDALHADHNDLYNTIERECNNATSEHYRQDFNVDALGLAISLCLIKGITYPSRADRLYTESTPTLANEVFSQFFKAEKVHKDAEKKAAAKMFKLLPEFVRNLLESTYADVKFNRKRYGTGQFYVWPIHEHYAGDPWPAAIFPKCVLMINILISLERKGKINSKEYFKLFKPK